MHGDATRRAKYGRDGPRSTAAATREGTAAATREARAAATREARAAWTEARPSEDAAVQTSAAGPPYPRSRWTEITSLRFSIRPITRAS